MDQQMFSEEDLTALENSLRANLQPIEPDQKFICELAHDLADASIQYRQKRIGQSLLLVAGGFVLGLLIFWIGRGFMEGESVD